MSADVSRRLDDIGASGNAALLAADVLTETGYKHDVAHTIGIRAAGYGGEIVLSALRKMGLLTAEIDLPAFDVALSEVRAEILPEGPSGAEAMK